MNVHLNDSELWSRRPLANCIFIFAVRLYVMNISYLVGFERFGECKEYECSERKLHHPLIKLPEVGCLVDLQK